MDELSEMGAPLRPRDATGLFPQYEGLVYGVQPGHARGVRAWLDERGGAVWMSWPRGWYSLGRSAACPAAFRLWFLAVVAVGFAAWMRPGLDRRE